MLLVYNTLELLGYGIGFVLITFTGRQTIRWEVRPMAVEARGPHVRTSASNNRKSFHQYVGKLVVSVR